MVQVISYWKGRIYKKTVDGKRDFASVKEALQEPSVKRLIEHNKKVGIDPPYHIHRDKDGKFIKV